MHKTGMDLHSRKIGLNGLFWLFGVWWPVLISGFESQRGPLPVMPVLSCLTPDRFRPGLAYQPTHSPHF
jgi:hypothetical protein